MQNDESVVSKQPVIFPNAGIQYCPPMPKQLKQTMFLGAPPSDPGGGFAARMKLEAPPPDPRRLRRKNEAGGSAPDTGGFPARM